jgi:D-glycero-D-manno-heptose 1,7-bisphosphate phosphatase
MQFKRKKPAAFLDRDGVINYERGYISKIDQIKFRKSVLSGLKFLTEKNLYIFIVTNQASIAKGFVKKKEFIKLNKNFINFFSKRKIKVTEIKYCPIIQME